MKYPVAITVNGRERRGEVEARTLLVQFIREELRLTATRGSNAYFLEFDRELEEVRTSLSLDESAESAHREAECQTRFLRGDCNDDGNVDLADAVCILNWLFLGEATPGCVAATNTDGVGAVDITDPIYLLTHLFRGGPAPVAPYPGCAIGTLPEDEGTCETPPENCPP